MSKTKVIELREIAKHYMMGEEGFYALERINLDIHLTIISLLLVHPDPENQP